MNEKDEFIKKQKCKDAQLYRIVIHKGDNEKRIYEEDLENYIKDGWEKGISDKHRQNVSKSHIGISTWNKGTKRVMKANKGCFKKGDPPWNKNRKGVQKSWNKGLTKDTDERVYRNSVSLIKAWENDLERHIRTSERAKGKKGSLSPKSLEHFLQTNYETRKKNNTFSTSKLEDLFYEYLCNQYDKEDIIRQYKDKERYPFRCDFYIPSKDLFIECNFHWTHGKHPFDINNPEDINTLNQWKRKSKTSLYYKNAIRVWTDLDVRKRKIAEGHNLNYITLYEYKI